MAYRPDSEILLEDPVFSDRIMYRDFVRRVLTVAGIVAGIGLVLGLLWYSIEVILLVFAGLLLAIFLHGLAAWIGSRTPLSHNWAMAIVLALLAGIIVIGVWLLLPTLQQQFGMLMTELPQTVNRLRESVSQYAAGRWLLEQIPPGPVKIGDGRQSTGILTRITGYVSAFLGVAVDVLIIVATGIYFAFNPRLYRNGLTKLFPAARQKRVVAILDTLGFTLQRWMAGRFAIMAINGLLTAIGLWILGSPIPLLLGLITAIFNFIPNIGPFLAAVPAISLALIQGPTQALYVAILFLIIQNLEGFVLTPLVQQKSIEMPPVLVLSSQLLLGILFGFLGILLAVPIVAVMYVLVRMVYVEDILGNPVEVKGEKQPKSTSA